MKKFMFTLTALLFAVTATIAQTERAPEDSKQKVKKEVQVQDQQENKKEIKMSEVPETIQQQLKSKEMAPWKPSKAYLTSEGIYVIKMMNGENPEETKKIKFKKDGTKLEK